MFNSFFTQALKKSSAESMCAPNKEVNKNLAVSHDSTECASSEVCHHNYNETVESMALEWAWLGVVVDG